MGSTSGNNTVQLVINVVDANSGEVISRSIKNVELLGVAGTEAGKKVAAGMAEASAAVTKNASATERGATASVAGFRRMSAEHANMAGKIKSQQQQMQQDLGRGFSGMNTFGGSSFTGGAVSDLKRVSDAAQNAAGHSRSALDNVRLAIADLGIRVPRAMEKVIAGSEGAMRVISGLGATMIGIGVIKIGFDIGKGVYDALSDMRDVNVEMRKYAQQAGVNAQQKLFDSASIEEVNALLRQTNGLIGGLDQRRVQAGVGMDNSGGFMQYLGKFAPVAAANTGFNPSSVQTYSKTNDQQRANLEAQKNLLEDRKRAIDAKRAVDQQEAKASADGMRLTGYAADAATKQNAMVLSKLKQDQARSEAVYQRNLTISNNNLIRQQNPSKKDEDLFSEGLRPIPAIVGKDFGQQERTDADLRAASESSARRSAMARKEDEQVAQARAQAQQAGLQGEALYRRQLHDTIDAFERQVRNSELSSAAAHKLSLEAKARYDAEYQQRRGAQLHDTERLEAEARSAGFTGLAKSDADLKLRLDEIDKAVKDTTLDPLLGERQKQAARDTTAADQQKLREDFVQHIQLMDDGRANSSMSANARVLADTRRTLAELQKVYDDLNSHLAANDPRRMQGQNLLDGEKAKINQAAQDQVQRNNQQLAMETRRMQAEAGRGGGGNRYAEQYYSIEADAEARAAQVEMQRKQAERDGDLFAEQQYRDQLIAIRRIADNKELDLAREQRDRLAGQLMGFFSNPMEALKRQGQEFASKAAADLLMGHMPGTNGGAGVSAPGGWSSLFRPTFGRNGGRPGARVGDAGAIHDVAAATGPQTAVVNAGTATINVTSASFNGVGAPSSAVQSIAGGGYVSAGNGGFFNLGSSPSSAGPPSSVAGGPYMPSGPLMSESPAQSAQNIYGTGKDAILQADGASKYLGVKGGLLSKVPGLNKLSDAQLGKLGGAAGGALGVFSAFEGKGGVMGGLQGALSGAQMGAQYGGPIGAAIGAGIGGLLGFIGHGARVQAQQYWFKELQPKLQAEMLGFQTGTAQYQAVYDDLNSSDREAKQRTKQMGSGAEDYYGERIHPAIQQYMQQITRQQKAGRSGMGMSGGQFHNGGLINGFGSFATSADEGFFHGKLGETVLHQQASLHYGDVAMMMNANTPRSEIADYLGGGGSNTRYAPSGDGDHFHLHTLDTQTAQQWIQDNKHEFRRAVNASYAENSGGADL